MTKKQIALAVAGTAAVAATVGTLYAIYRRRKSLKDMMAPHLRKFTPVQRKRFVVESHHHNLPGNTADEIVEKADNAVRRAKGSTMMKRKLSKRTIKTRRKRSSSTINHGKAAKIVLGVLTALAVAGGTTYAVLPRSKPSPSSPSSPSSSSSPSSPHSYHKYTNRQQGNLLKPMFKPVGLTGKYNKWTKSAASQYVTTMNKPQKPYIQEHTTFNASIIEYLSDDHSGSEEMYSRMGVFVENILGEKQPNKLVDILFGNLHKFADIDNYEHKPIKYSNARAQPDKIRFMNSDGHCFEKYQAYVRKHLWDAWQNYQCNWHGRTRKKNVKIGQHTKTIVGFDFDGVIHGCVSSPDQIGQVHPTSFDIQTLIRDKCVCTQITNIMKGHLANKDDVFIVSSNTTVGVNGIDTFLKHYGIPLPRSHIITTKGAKSTHINRHKITLFYEDSINHVNEIRKNAIKCKVIHWTQAQRTPRNHKSPSSAVFSMYKKPQHFIRGREAFEAKWISNPLTTVRLRYAVYLCIRSILNESKGMSLFQLATARKRLGQSFTPQVKHSSAHILLVRYPNDVYLLKNHKDRWMTPGGEVDSIHGKNVLFDTMKREFEEETGGDSRGNTHCPRLKGGWSYYDGGGRDNKGVWKTYRIYIARIDDTSPWDAPL